MIPHPRRPDEGAILVGSDYTTSYGELVTSGMLLDPAELHPNLFTIEANDDFTNLHEAGHFKLATNIDLGAETIRNPGPDLRMLSIVRISAVIL